MSKIKLLKKNKSTESTPVVIEPVAENESAHKVVVVHNKTSWLRLDKFVYWNKFRGLSVRSRAIAFVAIFGILGTGLLFYAAASPKPIELEGTLEIVAGPHHHGDSEAGHEHSEDEEVPYDFNQSYLYSLKTADGKRVPLKFKTEPEMRAGSKIKIKGHKSATTDKKVGFGIGTASAAPASKPTVNSDDGTPYVDVDSVPSVDLTQLTAILGPQRVAVIKVNFANASYSGVGTTSDVEIRNAFFDGPKSTNAFMSENSFGRATVTGDIFNVTIPNTTTEPDSPEKGLLYGCNGYGWAKAAVEALRAQGVSVDADSGSPIAPAKVTGYAHTALLLPPTTTCKFPAAGSIAGDKLSWYNGIVNPYVAIHEIGHNFGLQHANGLKCTSGKTKVSISTAANCTEIGYRDYFDALGGRLPGDPPVHYSVIHKEHLGWLYTSNILDINTSATYRIYRSDAATTRPMTVRFPRAGTNQFYYLETRRLIGFDAVFGNNSIYPVAEVARGVTIRLGRSNNESTVLLKADPALKTNSWISAPITASGTNATDTFTDSDAGVTIKFLTKTDRYNDIKITFTKPPIGTGEATPIANTFIKQAPQGSLSPLNLHNVNDCGSRAYMTAVDSLANLPSMLQGYTDKIGSAYDGPYGGAVALYSYKTNVKYSRTCTYDDYFFSTDANATKPASYDTRTWTRDEEVAWVFPTQVSGSIPLYHWACPINNSSNNSTLNPLVNYYHTDDQWIYRSYSAPGSCVRATIAYVMPANAADPGQPQAWQTSTNALPAGRTGHTSVTANGYVYVIGGAPGPSTTVYYAKLNADGTTGVWQTSPNSLPAPRTDHSSVVINGYVYVMGGDNDDSFGSQSSVYYAKLNADGTTGVWQTSTNSLPQPLQDMASATANGYIYTFGGTNSYFQKSVVYYAKANLDGTIGPWNTNTSGGFPTVSSAAAVISNGFVYALGGEYGATPRTTGYYAKLNIDGTIGTWTQSNLPIPLTHHTAIVTNGYMYTIGGETGSSGSQANGKIFFTKLNVDGSYGSWTEAANALPATRQLHSTIMSNGQVYVIGGQLTPFTGAVSIIYRSPF